MAQAVAVLERDSATKTALFAWRYPDLDTADEAVVLARSGLESDAPSTMFTFSRFGQRWFYTWTIASPGLAGLEAFAVVLVTADYFPEKWGTLCRIFAKLYATTGSPLKLLEGFLAVSTRGAFNPALEGVPTFTVAEHNIKACYLAGSLVELLGDFGQETVIIWTAMMLKKRVAVFGDAPAKVLKTVRTLPMLVWWRQCWDVLWPLVSLSHTPQLDELRNGAVWVAGFTTDPRPVSDLYDVLCDLTTGRVIVSDHAKDAFLLGTYHKTALATLSNAAAARDDQAVIKEVLGYSKGLVAQVQSLAQGQPVTLELLRAAELPPHMDHFLFQIAQAEGLTKG